MQWTRTQDGDHNGKPVYEYHAVSNGIRYHIVWAYDRGGTFGISICWGDRSGYPDDVRRGIYWGRTLKFCKQMAEEYNAKRGEG